MIGVASHPSDKNKYVARVGHPTSRKFVEEQPQVLRLTTPELDPKEQRSLFGDPEDVRGPVRSG
jgi:hypothetical protein